MSVRREFVPASSRISQIRGYVQRVIQADALDLPDGDTFLQRFMAMARHDNM